MLISQGLIQKLKGLAALVGAALTLVGCGGGSSAGNWSDYETAQFFGAGKVTSNVDGTWTLWWPALAVSDGVSYDVFQAKAGETFNYDKPATNTVGNTFQSLDLRQAGNTCFVVRALQYGEKVDSNTKEVCTHHETYTFAGIRELVSLKDGTYMVRWDSPPFAGAVFQVLSRKKTDATLQPLGMSDRSYYQTGVIPLAQSVCFAVQHRIQGFPSDSNTKEICTTEEQTGGFAGIEGITSPAQGTVKLWWKPSTRSNVENYRVYLGTTFRRSIALVASSDACATQTYNGENRVWCTYEQSNLPHAASYTYGVRAVDSFDREDDNRKVTTFELSNHAPVVASVAVTPSTGVGRPTSVTCAASYSDADSWQTLKPTFVFKNRKREQVGDVEVQRQTLAAGVQTASYTLASTDRHGDVIACDVVVSDGFGGTHALSSAPTLAASGVGTSFVIPDTPAVATTVQDTADGVTPAYLLGVRNTPREVSIALGTGYTDADSDAAYSITITNVSNGNVCLVTDTTCTVDGVGTWSTSKTFTCQADGTCKFQFVPKKITLAILLIWPQLLPQ